MNGKKTKEKTKPQDCVRYSSFQVPPNKPQLEENPAMLLVTTSERRGIHRSFVSTAIREGWPALHPVTMHCLFYPVHKTLS